VNASADLQVAGLYKRRFAFQQASGPEVDPPVETVLSDWMMSLVNTMRADMDNDKLYPPGSVYIMVRLFQPLPYIV
jgi:hypothetical protein